MPNCSARGENERGFGVVRNAPLSNAFRCIVLHSFAERRSEPGFEKPLMYGLKLVLPDRIELSTSSLPMARVCAVGDLSPGTA
jgi:hypothetical protein